MKTILVPQDFSDNAKKALDYAAALAQKSGARVLLHHAFAVPFTVENQDRYNQRKEEVKKELENLRDSIIAKPKFKNLEVDIYPKSGGLIETIRDMVRIHEVDLIVMGTQGVNNVNDVFFGSNTARVIREVECSVLAVPEEASFTDIKKIVYATDEHLEEELSLYDLKEIARLFDAEIHAVHVIPQNTKRDLTSVMKMNHRDKLFGKEIKHKSAKVIDDDVLTGINSYLASNPKVSMVAMLARKHSFMERIFRDSVTQQMALETTIPLLVIHEQ